MLSDDLTQFARYLRRAVRKGPTDETLLDVALRLSEFAVRARLLEAPRTAFGLGADKAVLQLGDAALSEQMDWLATCCCDAVKEDGEVYLDAEETLGLANLFHQVAERCRVLEAGTRESRTEPRPRPELGDRSIVHLDTFRRRMRSEPSEGGAA